MHWMGDYASYVFVCVFRRRGACVPDELGTRDGLVPGSEVDFAVGKGPRRYYIQSAYQPLDAQKEAQEKSPLLLIKDSFKKTLIEKSGALFFALRCTCKWKSGGPVATRVAMRHQKSKPRVRK